MISRQVCLGLALTIPVFVSAQENSLDQLMSMSLEELSMLDVESDTKTYRDLCQPRVCICEDLS
ncbi:hypothetical protein FCV85_15020 [Vibrio sp. F13]|nr:hypothetical protein FCV85_15020 [Vibrio sp. F13]